MGQQKLDFRGGKREGAGRKKIGITRRCAITLSEEQWKTIDRRITESGSKSFSEYVRKKLLESDSND